MTQMRAAVIAGPGRIELEDVPLRDPTAGQVRLKLEGCGVCGSNLPPFEGRSWFQYPFAPGAPGHEGWGIIEALGKGVKGLKEGDRVAALSSNAYAEYDWVEASKVVPLSSKLSGKPFPGEPLGCAINVFRRCNVQAGQTVAIVGIGFMGAVLTRLCANAGARVIALSRRPFALEVAEAFGAWHSIPMHDHAAIIEQVHALTSGTFCDCVIEAVGHQWPLDLSAELTRERGRLVIAGYHQDGPRQVNMQLWNWRGLDVINAHERDPNVYLEGIRMAQEEVTAGHLDPSMLYTHTFRLGELSKAFVAMRERPDGFLKALVVP